MAKFSRWDRKVVQGATVAAVSTAGAAASVAAIESNGPFNFFDQLALALQSDIYTSVGIPAFVAGVLFFPVGLKALGSRFGFALRAAASAAAVSFVNRVLVWASYARPDSLPDGLKEIFATPALLWPRALDAVAFGLDWNALLGISATLLAGGLAWAAQPLLKRIARQPRFEPISTFDSQPMRVPARARVR
jgi:hypothetical protein